MQFRRRWLVALTSMALWAHAAVSAIAQEPAPAPQRVRIQLTRQAIREKAKVQIDTGQADQALRNLNAVIAKFPNDEEALYLIGRAWESKDNIDSAIQFYSKAPTVREAHAALARVYREKKQDMIAAERAADVGLSKFPAYVPLLVEKTILLINREQFMPAEQKIRQAIALPTGDTIPNRFYLGQALFGQKKYDEAKLVFTPIAEQTQRPRYGRAAKDYLQAITFEQRPKAGAPKTGEPPPKAWSLRARIRGEYDTNVALYPDGEKIPINPASPSDTDDFRFVTELGGSFRFHDAENRSFGLTGNVYNGLMFRLDTFQTLAMGGGLYGQFRGGQGIGEWLVRSSVDASLAFYGKYGSDPDGPASKQFREFGYFSQTYGLTNRGLYRLANNWLMNGGLSLNYAKFASDGSIRDSLTVGLNAGPGFESAPGVGGFRVDLTSAFRYRNAKSDDYTFVAYGAGLTGIYRLIKQIDFVGGMVFDHRNHFDSGPGGAANYSKKRADNNLTWFTGTEWRLFQSDYTTGSLTLTYGGEKNLSTLNGKNGNSNLEYTKHVISLGFGVQL